MDEGWSPYWETSPIDWVGGGACVAVLASGGLVLRWVSSSSSFHTESKLMLSCIKTMKTGYCLMFAIQDLECGGYKIKVPWYFPGAGPLLIETPVLPSYVPSMHLKRSTLAEIWEKDESKKTRSLLVPRGIPKSILASLISYLKSLRSMYHVTLIDSNWIGYSIWCHLKFLLFQIDFVWSLPLWARRHIAKSGSEGFFVLFFLWLHLDISHNLHLIKAKC